MQGGKQKMDGWWEGRENRSGSCMYFTSEARQGLSQGSPVALCIAFTDCVIACLVISMSSPITFHFRVCSMYVYCASGLGFMAVVDFATSDFETCPKLPKLG